MFNKFYIADLEIFRSVVILLKINLRFTKVMII